MDFNKQQEEIINSIGGNIAVIASAGSGKTTTLTNRIKNMVENHGCTPSTILAVTFSKKAKDTISDKLENIDVYGVNVETFHSLALKIIISVYGEKYTVWNHQWEKEKFIQEICVSKFKLCSQKDVPFNEICSFISLQKVNMSKPTDSLIPQDGTPFSLKKMGEIYSTYESMKKDKGYIEFDDFLNMANDIFSSHPDILDLYRKRFKYILVDEFQDVSLSQYVLLNSLGTCNTMIVGDPLQAIYSFRGGDDKYILNFDTDYKDTKVINLNTNYRCSFDIVNTANMLSHSVSYSKHRNYVESIAHNGKHKIPELRRFSDNKSESEWIATKIKTLINEGYKYDDISILSRTNAQLQTTENVLYKEQIPFEVVNGKLFTELPEIKLIVSYLKLALDQDDNLSFQYLYNKPNRWLNKKFLEETEENSVDRKCSLYKSMFTIRRRNWRFKDGIDEIIEVIEHLKRKKDSNVSNLVRYIRKRLSIDYFVSKGNQSDDGSYTEAVENLDTFESICEKYESIEDLIYYLDDMDKEISNETGDNVKLLTIHKSKGMEYPVVFIIGCNDGLLPHFRSDNEEDERRLLYVAITRAEKELYLSYADFYNGKLMGKSPFLDDIVETVNFVDE